MKANEIQGGVESNFVLFYPEPREHYKQFLSGGQVFPTTKAQARAFIQKGAPLDLLGLADVVRIEALLNKHGFEGDYAYTKKKHWLRLKNQEDFVAAVQKEYHIRP